MAHSMARIAIYANMCNYKFTSASCFTPIFALFGHILSLLSQRTILRDIPSLIPALFWASIHLGRSTGSSSVETVLEVTLHMCDHGHGFRTINVLHVGGMMQFH
jgi:hypothetical protein